MNEERPTLQFHEESRSHVPDWPRHPFRAAEGQILCNMIRGGGVRSREKKRFKESAIKHAYLFLLSRQMTSTRYDRGPPSRPSKACDHGRPQEANRKKKYEEAPKNPHSLQRSRLDGANETGPDLSANIEKVRYKIVRTLPGRTTLDRRVIGHPPQP